MASFLEMPDDTDALQFAKIDEVYNYLRRNRNLQIPDHWKDLVPRPM